MSSRKGRWRSVKDALWLLLGLTLVSMMLSLHLQDGLGWLGSSSHVKAVKSDFSHNIEGNEVIRIFDKLASVNRSSSNVTTAGIPQPLGFPQAIYHSSTSHNNNQSIKTNHSPNGNHLPSYRNHGENAQENAESPERNTVETNHISSDSVLTRLSDNRTVRDDYRNIARRVKLKGKNRSVQIAVAETEGLQTVTGELNTELSPRHGSAGKILSLKSEKITGQSGLSKAGDSSKKLDRKTSLGESTEETQRRKFHRERKKSEKTQGENVGDNGRLWHSFHLRDSRILTGQNTPARVTSIRRPGVSAGRAIIGSSTASVQGLRPTDDDATTSEDETDTGIPGGGQARTSDLQASLHDHISQVSWLCFQYTGLRT
ncbi:hypothetical protein ElyMa_003956200 [Elysia marginata]|uniref:Uncharacterized protein n=1 Tax=Elysia marginata TaxID=1093978 RepID=A0AAV4FVE5_9GAST|nr:hypothetical protein ElyMa_003956200 [Elysia marginata]